MAEAESPDLVAGTGGGIFGAALAPRFVAQQPVHRRGLALGRAGLLLQPLRRSPCKCTHSVSSTQWKTSWKIVRTLCVALLAGQRHRIFEGQ